MEKWKKSCNEYKSIGENDEGDKQQIGNDNISDFVEKNMDGIFFVQ